MTTSRRLSTLILSGLAFLAVAVGPAYAIEDSGTQNCQAGYTPRAVASAYGNLLLKGPGEANYTSYYIAGSTFMSKARPGPGGYWRAFIDGAGNLNIGGTYGECLPAS